MTMFTERGKSPSSKKSQERIKKERRARLTALANGSQTPPELASQTLGIYKTKNGYFLKYVDIIAGPRTGHTVEASSDVFRYNQFIEAINALRHNNKFIALAGKFNKIHSVQDKTTGETTPCLVDLEYLRSLKFEYDKDILSVVNSNSTSNSVPVDEILFENLLCNILETSIRIINSTENSINFDNLRKKIKGFDANYKQVQLAKENAISTANTISSAIKNGTLSLDSLHDEVVKHTANNGFLF